MIPRNLLPVSFAFALTAGSLVAQTPVIDPLSPAETGSQTSPFQSPARPFGLDIVNLVQISGSDTNSANFNNNVLPGMRAQIAAQLPELKNNSALGAVDPLKLTLDADYSMRVYFISEGAAFRNTLGFNTTDPTTAGNITTSPDAKLIFPNASDPKGLQGGGVQNISNPLNPGDFVNLGVFTKDTQLDFFIISNGASSPQLSSTYSTASWFNPGGLNQAVSLSPSGSTYLLLSFEDVLTSGGDKDMNDLIFAVEFVKVSAPEPSLAAGALLVGLFSLSRRRRN